ncbi:MAG: type IIL restriction-modification enzyme MmeI [Halobacteriota archaeon]
MYKQLAKLFKWYSKWGRYPNASLADLYDPLAMPKGLLDAHKKLDRAVDRCYRRQAFKTDSERLRFLFEQYIALTASKEKA